MARLPRVTGRGRAREVLLGSDDVRGADAESLGYVNRALPDGELDNFVHALATRIASFDKWAIANTKRLVNASSLPADVEIRAGWDACMASVKRPAAQEGIKTLLEQGLQEPGDSENRLGSAVGRLAAQRVSVASGTRRAHQRVCLANGDLSDCSRLTREDPLARLTSDEQMEPAGCCGYGIAALRCATVGPVTHHRGLSLRTRPMPPAATVQGPEATPADGRRWRPSAVGSPRCRTAAVS